MEFSTGECSAKEGHRQKLLADPKQNMANRKYFLT